MRAATYIGRTAMDAAGGRKWDKGRILRRQSVTSESKKDFKENKTFSLDEPKHYYVRSLVGIIVFLYSAVRS